MIQNRQTCGKYWVFTISMSAGDMVDFKVKDPNNLLQQNVSLNIMLEGGCNLKVVGSIMSDGKLTGHIRSSVIPALAGFDTYWQNNNWVGEGKATMTTDVPSIYLCVSIKENNTSLPISYQIVDMDSAVIPVGALFIPTVSCGEYLKNQPYVNETSGLTLPAQDGKVIIIQEVEQ